MLYVLLLVVTMLVVCSINAYVEVFQRVLVDSLFVVLHPLNLCWAKVFDFYFVARRGPLNCYFFPFCFKLHYIEGLPTFHLKKSVWWPPYLWENSETCYVSCMKFCHLVTYFVHHLTICNAELHLLSVVYMPCYYFLNGLCFTCMNIVLVSMKWNSEWSDLSVKVNLHQCFKPSCGELTLKKWHSSVRNVDSYCVS